MKRILFIVLLTCFTLKGIAQHNEESPNSVYERFSFAYQTLNAQILSNCYVTDATLLNLYDGSSPNSIKGVNNIVAFFEAFFQRSKERQLQMNLSFKIIDRQKINNLYYDNGFYKLTYVLSDGTEQTSYGKLSTILQWDNGSWKFKVDANCNTDGEEYLNADSGSIPQPK